ncbi:hypothetical protein BJ742DRAFT_814109 [Cladochytrium replicatum]|nr:hypothetical protein BJ742DRAFT_814109 [Cladochytrium replicatum]
MSKYEPIFSVDEHLDTPESQLEFQNFVLGSAEQNLTSGKVKPAPQNQQRYDFVPTQQTTSTGGTPAQPGVRPAFWSLEYYAQFFDVDTDDVYKRILASVNPFSSTFLDEVISTNPDLYGPFWIPTTVIFALFVASSVAQSIADYISGKTDSAYDVTLVTFALMTVYTYVTGLPAVLWGIGKYIGAPIRLMDMVNVYGYGVSVWVPVSIVCIVPLELVRWLLVLGAFALSTLFMVRSIFPAASQSTRGVAGAHLITAVIVAANAALALAFKFVFFNFVISVSNGSGGGAAPPQTSTAPGNFTI